MTSFQDGGKTFQVMMEAKRSRAEGKRVLIDKTFQGGGKTRVALQTTDTVHTEIVAVPH